MRVTRRPRVLRVMAFLSCIVSECFWAFPAVEQRTPDDEMKIFKAWLDHQHEGYRCDEGPAAFRNATVEAAYSGHRFYYVLTYARGVRPPFENSLSLVAYIDGNGKVQPLDSSSLAAYRSGLRKVSTAGEARQAAAAVLILALGDPGERRWKFGGNLFTIKRNRKGWVCTYRHGDVYHTSQVTFDRGGVLSALSCNPPPVP